MLGQIFRLFTTLIKDTFYIVTVQVVDDIVRFFSFLLLKSYRKLRRNAIRVSPEFGYDVVIGNGLGSAPVADNDKRKSVTVAAHINPVDKLYFGVSWYNDAVSKGASRR